MKKIGKEDIRVLLEVNSEDNYIEDGIAISNGRYDKYAYNPAISIPSQKANKSNQEAFQNQWKKVTGFVADGSFPSTQLSNNELTATHTGQVKITTHIEMTAINAGVLRYEVRVNDELLFQQYASKTNTFYRVVELVAGDKLSLWAIASPGPRGNSEVDLLSGTYLKLEHYTQDNQVFDRDFAFQPNSNFFTDSFGTWVTPTYLKEGHPAVHGYSYTTSSNHVGSSYLARGSASGPVLCQNRYPIPAIPGGRVNFSGTFRVRRTGNEREKRVQGGPTAVLVRFSIWGVGHYEDEYGEVKMSAQELRWEELPLQPRNTKSETIMEFVLQSLPDATVPDWVTGIYFTACLTNESNTTPPWHRTSFTDNKEQTENGQSTPKTAVEMKYFAWSSASPMTLTIKGPEGFNETYRHPLSKTGVAFKNRSIYKNTSGRVRVVFFGAPGASSSINIYNSDGVIRGSQIGTYSASPGERKEIEILPTSDCIEIASASDFYVERVVNVPYRDNLVFYDQIYKRTYVDITGDVSKLDLKIEEGGYGEATVDFSSDVYRASGPSPIKVGRTVKILGRHYEENEHKPSDWSGPPKETCMFTGKIRKISSSYDYEDEPITQISVYDDQDVIRRFENESRYYDFIKYANVLNSLGINFFICGENIGGKKYRFRENNLMEPDSVKSNSNLYDSLKATRNSQKGYLYCDGEGNVHISRELPNGIKCVLSDKMESGAIGYGRLVDKIDTKDTFNQIKVDVGFLNGKEFADRSLTTDNPPINLRYPRSTTKTGTYNYFELEEIVGITSKNFEVVLKKERINDLFVKNQSFSYESWAMDIFSRRSEILPQARELNVPIKSSYGVYKISNISLYDKVTIKRNEEEFDVRVRHIEHIITPGKWTTKLSFHPGTNGVYW